MSSQSVSIDMDTNPIAPLNEPYQPFDYEDYEGDDDVYEEEFHQEEASIGSNLAGTLVAHKFEQKRMCLKLISWIICVELPFRTVEHPRFKELFVDTQPKYKVPCRKTIAKGVLELFFGEKEKMKRQLNGVRVSITTDTWTSIQNINYMVVIVHFVDAEWILHKRIIGFKKITSHEGEDIGSVLDACLIEWGIENVLSITLDNATANDGLIDYMKRRLIGRGTLFLGGIYSHVRCACHIINLIVKDGIKELGSSVEGIRNCVKFIHSSPARLDMFRGFTINENMANISMDVVTRWNSTYKMLISAAKYEHVFAKMANDCDNFKAYFKERVSREVNGEKVHTTREGPPTPEHWKKAISLSQFLQNFYDATKLLSGTKYPTSHLILENVLGLQVDILKALDDDSSDAILKSVAATMKKKSEKYWGDVDEICPIMFVAHVLDPRVKLDMLDVILPDFNASAEKIKETKVLVKEHLTRLYLEYKGGCTNQESIPREGEAASGRSLVVSGSSSTSGGNNIFRQKLVLLRKATESVVITNEVDLYLNDPCENQVHVLFDLLGWWKNNCTIYPVLSMVAKDVFAIPSSSVASESTFNLGGKVVDPFRASLTPKTVEALVCTSDWLRSEGFQFDKKPTEDEVELYKELEELEKKVSAHVDHDTKVAVHDSVPVTHSPLVPSPSTPSPGVPSLPPRGGRLPRGGRPPREGGRRSKRGRLN